MFILKKKTIVKVIILAIITILITVITVLTISINNENKNIFKAIKQTDIMILGGNIQERKTNPKSTIETINKEEYTLTERFRRPSNQKPLDNPYMFTNLEDEIKMKELSNEKFKEPQNVILAYYAILRNASNMLNYTGGCGSIGLGDIPYQYAYNLFTEEKQREMTLQKFEDSFKGTGYITLLKLLTTNIPEEITQNLEKPSETIKHYLIEIETITGYKVEDSNINENTNANVDTSDKGSLFKYYYGVVTTEKTKENGWKIKNIDYLNEDFLCAPEHGWFYLAEAFVNIVYKENLKIIERIDYIKQEGDITQIYASGYGNKYRFDFVRLTNGYDILINKTGNFGDGS